MAVDLGELSGAWNFRDVAEETGVRPGRFFRSSELSGLDDAGRRALLGSASPTSPTCGRPAKWSATAPGAVPAGVEVHHLHFHEVTAVDGEAPHETAFQKMMTEKPDDEDIAVAAGRFMTEEYSAIPDAGRRTTRCAASHFVARRRAGR